MSELKQVGYTISDACQALGFARSGNYAVTHAQIAKVDVFARQDGVLIERIKVISGAYPF